MKAQTRDSRKRTEAKGESAILTASNLPKRKGEKAKRAKLGRRRKARVCQAAAHINQDQKGERRGDEKEKKNEKL